MSHAEVEVRVMERKYEYLMKVALGPNSRTSTHNPHTKSFEGRISHSKKKKKRCGRTFSQWTRAMSVGGRDEDLEFVGYPCMPKSREI